MMKLLFRDALKRIKEFVTDNGILLSDMEGWLNDWIFKYTAGILFSPPKNKVDSSDTLCYDLLDVKNLKESEVIILCV